MKEKDRYAARHLWYLGEAQTLIRDLQALVWPKNWHVALGGGVLNHGYSNDDLDIYILPLNKHAKTADVRPALDTLLDYSGAIGRHSAYHNMAPAIETADIYLYKGKRIDVFVFEPHCQVCEVTDRLLGFDEP
jgi:hypothetical protein